MFSNTTMALSINIPTASAMPPRLMMFSVMSKASISTNVPSTEAGMVAVTISVLRTSFRNRYSTSTANNAPMMAADCTSSMAAVMKSAWL